ncbi:2-oxo acid dehydrogenase subunit E2, partial [Proteus mirabilis]|uniref:2-oxo acid dehydrogenase subunit E2 n=1 Tax=Proteus mirabilis TaxID=584 RepID=UPI00391CBF0C
INPADVKGSGVGGRLTRQDIERHVANNKSATAATAEVSQAPLSHRSEKRVPMTRLRKRVAERLLEAKNTTAMLTTFNEINMQPIKNLRAQYGEAF